jgi:5-methylcytosine-specific restriction endonuclease McrA
MPMRAPRICQCGLKVAGGAVCICQQRRKADADKRRPSAHHRGYGTRWKTEITEYLARPANKFCACGCGRRANMVHHKIAHKGDQRRFWDRSNWAPYNSRCNSRECASSEGGFGNPMRLGKAVR